jgi:predicted AAA+ superfamily ATPase
LKSPKFYFYDTGQVVGDPGAKLENLVACALLKEIHYLADCYGEEKHLYYLRNKDGKEVDFFITSNEDPTLMVEVKWRDENVNPNFKIFKDPFPGVKMLQIVKELKREKTFPNGIEITRVFHFHFGFLCKRSQSDPHFGIPWEAYGLDVHAHQ